MLGAFARALTSKAIEQISKELGRLRLLTKATSEVYQAHIHKIPPLDYVHAYRSSKD
jgi:hypothetical protein